MHRAIVAALLFSSAVHARAQARCDSTWPTRGVPVERTLIFSASAGVRDGVIPRPFSDGVLDRMSDVFRLPAKVSVPLYTIPPRMPGDSSAKPKATWAHADIHVLVRTTLDRAGVVRRMELFEPSYDPALDSAFVASVRYALTDTVWLNHRPPPILLPGDSTVLDIVLDVQPARDRKETAAFEKRVRDNKEVERPVRRLTLLHFPNAAPPKRLGRPVPLHYPAGERYSGVEGFVQLRTVVDTTGKMVESWYPEATNRDFIAAVQDFILANPNAPATIAGCPVAMRTSEPFHFHLRWP